MEVIFDFGLDVTRWLQTTYPQLEGFFFFISTLGLEEFYLAFFPLIYWSLDKRLGKHLGYLFLLALTFTELFKQLFRGPRPFWFDSSLERSLESSYGIPSGHTLLTTVIYIFLAAWIRRRWMTLLAIFMVIAMPLSRIYLGVHFVHDALGGFLIGLLILGGYVLWQRRLEAQFSKRILGQRLLLAVLVPVFIAIVYALVRFIIGEPNLSVLWAAFIPDAEMSSLRGIATATGTLLGFGIGAIFESSRIRFRADGAIWQRLLRYLLGMVVTLALWAGLGELFPDDPLWLAIPLRVLRYVLILLWVSYYAPLAFVRLHLAKAEPDPGISMTL